MPKANDNHPYNLIDIPEIYIPDKVLEYARKIAFLLERENKGQKTRYGTDQRDIKGFIGQWAVHRYLKDEGWDHEFSKPYVEKQYGDSFDIKFGDELWEVKTRDWWKEDYFFNIRILMGEHEKLTFDHKKKCDYYIFVTTTRDYKKAYILGGISGYGLWNSLQNLTESEGKYIKYPTEGKIYSRQLAPIRKVILKG